MKFNPTDKSDSIIADIDFLLYGKSDTFNTDYSLIDRTRNINIELDDTVALLFRANPEFLYDDTTNVDFPIATVTIEAGKDHVILPDSSLVIHRLRVQDGNGKYKTITPKLRREIDDTTLDGSGFPETYYKMDNAIFFAPAPNAGTLIELQFQRGANHFASTDTNQTPGFNSQFHQILSIGAARRYAIANGLSEKTKFLTDEKTKIEGKIAEFYQNRPKDTKPGIKLKRPSVRNYGF